MLQFVKMTVPPDTYTPPPCTTRTSRQQRINGGDGWAGGAPGAAFELTAPSCARTIVVSSYPSGRWIDSGCSHSGGSVLVDVAAGESDFASLDINASTLPAESVRIHCNLSMGAMDRFGGALTS